MEVLGLSIHVIGEVLIAYTVLRVHHRVKQEHRIDKKVFVAMKREQVLGMIGIGLILIGYVMQVAYMA